MSLLNIDTGGNYKVERHLMSVAVNVGAVLAVFVLGDSAVVGLRKFHLLAGACSDIL